MKKKKKMTLPIETKKHIKSNVVVIKLVYVQTNLSKLSFDFFFNLMFIEVTNC